MDLRASAGGEGPTTGGVLVEQVFVGSEGTGPVGVDILPHRSNFLIGNDPSLWRTDVPSYQGVLYQNVWDNVDIEYLSTPGGLKYNVHVRPGGRVEDVNFEYRGIDDLRVEDYGLVVSTGVGEVRDDDLLIYQTVDGRASPVPGRLVPRGPTSFGFELEGRYAEDRVLVIDPVLTYSTYVGSPDRDECMSIGIGPDDTVYLVGTTDSPDFPVTPGAYQELNGSGRDAFVLRMDAAGMGLVYSTYLGGSGDDWGVAIAVDATGNAHVAGQTGSGDFPVTDDAFAKALNGTTDAFVLALNASGEALLHSTLLGGDGDDTPMDIELDGADNPLVAGVTSSTDFPVTGGAYCVTYTGIEELFVTKLEADCSALVYSTLLGGSEEEYVFALAVDDVGSAYVTGYTFSDDFPVTPGAYQQANNQLYDVFVTKFDPSGADLAWSTFLGGWLPDFAYDIEVDDSRNVYVSGLTQSDDFPTTEGAYINKTTLDNDLFVTKLDSGGADLVYSTFVGGSETGKPLYIALGPSDDVFYTGSFNRGTYATTAGAFDTTFNGWQDGILGRLSPDGGDLLYSTFLGGTDSEEPIGVVLDGHSNAYVAGMTRSDDFPTTTGAFNQAYNGNGDAFLAKADIVPPVLVQNLTAISGTTADPFTFSAEVTDNVVVSSVQVVYWFGDGDPTNATMDGSVTDPDRFDLTVSGAPFDSPLRYYFNITDLAGNVLSTATAKVDLTIVGVPGPPTGLEAVVEADGIRLTWEPPEDDGGAPVTNYSVFKGLSADDLAPMAMVNVTALDDTALTMGETYFYAVAARNRYGLGPPTVAIPATAMDLPGAPEDVVSVPGVASVTIRWERPSDNGGSPIISYKVYRGLEPEVLLVTAEVGPVPRSYVDVNVTVGLDYHYGVSAVTAVGEGPMSEVVPGYLLAPPSAPEGLEATAGDEAVVLSWEAPSFDGRSPVTGYIVLRGLEETDLSEVASLGNVLDHTDTGLDNGVTYHYAVVAYNVVGTGPRAGPISTTPFRPPGTPGAPAGLEAVATGTDVSLSWMEPPDDGGSPITGYLLLRGTSREDLMAITGMGPVTATTDKGLSEDLTYYYCVVASNALGEGERSQVVSVDIGQRTEAGPDAGPLYIISAFIVVVLAFAGSVAIREPSKYWWGLAVVPLFSRIAREQVLDNNTRLAMHGLVVENPGIHYSAILRNFGLSNGAAAYHLDVLERENFLRSVSDGRLKRFYSTDMKVPKDHKKTPEEVREEILVLVEDRPGISQKEIVSELGITRDSAGYFLRELVSEKKIKDSRKGKYTIYHLSK